MSMPCSFHEPFRRTIQNTPQQEQQRQQQLVQGGSAAAEPAAQQAQHEQQQAGIGDGGAAVPEPGQEGSRGEVGQGGTPPALAFETQMAFEDDDADEDIPIWGPELVSVALFSLRPDYSSFFEIEHELHVATRGDARDSLVKSTSPLLLKR
jgi:hypothetical protein